MTLKITKINSCSYNQQGEPEFVCECGPEFDYVVCTIQTGEKNEENNATLEAWLLENTPEPYVEPEVDLVEMEIHAGHLRRSERTAMFAQTIDKITPMWYDNMSLADKATVAAWRTAWLDYPSTAVLPEITAEVANLFDLPFDDGTD
jgi:hypothetical protein